MAGQRGVRCRHEIGRGWDRLRQSGVPSGRHRSSEVGAWHGREGDIQSVAGQTLLDLPNVAGSFVISGIVIGGGGEDVKKMIESTQGADVYPVAQLMLVYQGKVLKDSTTLEENKIAENSFVMLTKGFPNVGSNIVGANTLDFLRNCPQFQALRAMVQANPQIMQPMLQELGKQNPQLMRMIQDH